MKTLKIAFAVIKNVNEDGESIVLVIKRSCRNRNDGWELPGGKVGAGKTPQEALKKAIMKKWNIEIEVNELIDEVEYDCAILHVSISYFWCEIVDANLPLEKHKNIRWMRINQLNDMKRLPVYKNIIAKIGSKPIDPIVFMNTPIKGDDKDAIGITSNVEMIKTAINNNAHMIGIVAEYGAGKSSLTELLAASNDYKQVIHINMWDSLIEDNDNNHEISNLTKSFIYQLARGKSKGAAGYVNRILNDNFGVISFSVGYRRTWVLWIVSIIFGAIYLIGDNISIYSFVKIFGENSRTIGMMFLWLAPVAGIVGIVLAALGVYFSSFAFSFWKDSNKRRTGINEVFFAYEYVVDLLLDTEKPTLVIVDDLDRIEEKHIIKEFLKELYRFNSICVHKKKKNPVFLISISPEENLKERKNIGDDDKRGKLGEECIYSKIFDYIISLKPVHYDDYRNVISQIIESEPGNKARLNEMLSKHEQIERGELPDSFLWLYKGENLSLRELKERLNRAIALYIDLRNKCYEGIPSINFKTCACVTYLECTYPENYYSLLKKEKEFSQIIQDSYIWRNVDGESKLDEITKKLDDSLGKMDINHDIAQLILDGIVDTDYRMYFYSFPKGSYIKDLDEKDICNYLEFPKDYPMTKAELDEKMERLEVKNRLSIIDSVVFRIAKTDEIIYFPELLLDSKMLWEMACKYGLDKAVESYNYYLNWEEYTFEECCNKLRILSEFAINEDNGFWISYIEKLSEECSLYDEDTIIKIRKSFISVFSEKVLGLKIMFCGEGVPIISEQEMELINDASKAICLINTSGISEKSSRYIQELVLSKRLDEDVIENAIAIQKKIIKIASFDRLANEVFDFMYLNKVIDDEIFELLCDKADEGVIKNDDITKYLNGLDSNLLSIKYLERIDQLCIRHGLNKDILHKLVENELYTSLLLNIEDDGNKVKIDFFAEEVVPSVLAACEVINTKYPQDISGVRLELVRLNGGVPNTKYNELYRGDYCIISKDELCEISDFIDALSKVDASKFTFDNYSEYVAFINKQRHEGEECFCVFDLLFNEDAYDEACTDADIVRLIVEQLDFSKVIFSSMTDEDITFVIRMLKKPLGLTKVDNVKWFMKKVRCLIQQFEEMIINGVGFADYIEFINDVNMVSEYTVTNIIQRAAEFKLNSAVTGELLKRKEYKHYIVGKSLYEGRLVFPLEQVPQNVFLALYYPTSPIWELFMENHKFLEWVMDNRIYREFTMQCIAEKLSPFMEMKQTSDFLEFVLETLAENQIVLYLKNLNEISSEADSIAISHILTDGKNIKFIKDDEIFKHVEFRLWDNVKTRSGYKGAFTRKRNEYLFNKNL